jgi:orotate phosphoribosyltransferase
MSFSMGRERDRIATKLFNIGAVKFGAFKLKLHETHPEAPLSPFYLNLRTPDNKKPGPLSLDIVVDIISELRDEIRASGLCETPPIHIAGLPNAGDPFARALFGIRWCGGSLITLNKTESSSGRRISALKHGGFAKGDKVAVIDDVVTGADTKLEGISVL